MAVKLWSGSHRLSWGPHWFFDALLRAELPSLATTAGVVRETSRRPAWLSVREGGILRDRGVPPTPRRCCSPPPSQCCHLIDAQVRRGKEFGLGNLAEDSAALRPHPGLLTPQGQSTLLPWAELWESSWKGHIGQGGRGTVGHQSDSGLPHGSPVFSDPWQVPTGLSAALSSLRSRAPECVWDVSA